MKNVVFILSLLLLVACADNRQYVIKGDSEGLTEGYKVYLLQWNNESESLDLLATDVVENNSFAIKGVVDEPCVARR